MVWWGWQKLEQVFCFLIPGIADSSTDFLQNFTLSTSSKFSTKSSKIQKSSSSNHLSYHISLKPTKIKHLSHFQTKKSNFHLAKNLHTNLKSSLFIGTFTDNHFQSKIPIVSTQHSGYHKTTRKTIKTVISLSYFYAKIKSNREYITRNL